MTTTREELEWQIEKLRRLLARASDENVLNSEELEKAERGVRYLLDAVEQ